jgi:hypothetical protein
VWTADGKTLELKRETGAMTAGLTEDAKLIGGEQVWDVLDRRSEDRGLFLLKYYAKAAKDVDAASGSVKLPVEVFAKRDGGVCVLTVREGNKPVAGSQVVVTKPGAASPLTLKTDASGETRFALFGDGEYQVRAMVADQEPGKWQEKSYHLVRNYSTLTFAVKKSAPDAKELLESAQRLRETWDKNFPGFTAQVVVEEDGEIASGPLKVAADGSVEVSMEDPDLKSEAKNTIQSITMHRLARANHYNSEFGPEDHHPQGRAILLKDGAMGSMYRVKDGQIRQVNRAMGNSHFTIDMLQNTVLEDGKYLPATFTVTYRDGKTGKLQHTETYSERYENVGGYWLPVERRIVTAEEGKTSIFHIQLKNLRLNAAVARNAE